MYPLWLRFSGVFKRDTHSFILQKSNILYQYISIIKSCSWPNYIFVPKPIMLSQVDPTQSLHYCQPDNRTTQAVVLQRTQFYTFALLIVTKVKNALLFICSFYTYLNVQIPKSRVLYMICVILSDEGLQLFLITSTR